jgi:hypothetical protein
MLYPTELRAQWGNYRRSGQTGKPLLHVSAIAGLESVLSLFNPSTL